MNFYPITKRTFDILLSAVGLLILAPLIILIAVAVCFDSHGSPLYLGARVGLKGRPFLIYKFRSMVLDQKPGGAPITYQGDPRVTRLGVFLRRWKLDELPNIINVLLGDMSLVGPRPESPRFVAQYTPVQQGVLSVKPGIACLTQIRFPNEQADLPGGEYNQTAYLVHMAQKLELDLLYVHTASFFGDIIIIFFTILAIIGLQVDLEPYFQARDPRSERSPAS